MKKVLLAFTLIAVCCFTANAQCGDLFISEVSEGRGNNKAFEIYNPTDEAINLSQYKIQRYSNGGGPADEYIFPSVDLAPGDVFVLVNGQTTWELNGASPPCDPALQAIADALDVYYPAPTYANGDDAMALEKSINGNWVYVDIFGKIGEDPDGDENDTGWTNDDGSVQTRDATLVRKSSISTGVSVNPDSFDPSDEWIFYPRDVVSTLGHHTADCQQSVCDMPVLDFSTWCESSEGYSMRIFTLASSTGDATFTISDNRGSASEALVLNPTEDQYFGLYPDDTTGTILTITNDQNGDCISTSLTETPFFRGAPNCDSLVDVSIQSLILTNTKVFPNPAQDDLFFVSDEIIDNVYLFSTTGQLLIEKNIHGINGQLDITNIPTGVYLFKIDYDEKRSSFQKVIIE